MLSVHIESWSSFLVPGMLTARVRVQKAAKLLLQVECTAALLAVLIKAYGRVEVTHCQLSRHCHRAAVWSIMTVQLAFV
eukprot:2278210-Amphidinium_carterae.1